MDSIHICQCGCGAALFRANQRFVSGHNPPKPIDVRFWEKVDKNGPVPAHFPELGPCWEWLGKRGPGGYGRACVGGNKYMPAHKLAWVLTNGPMPEDKQANHRCHRRLCVRPDHVYSGTQKQNMDDMIAAGRQAKGDSSGARLHPERWERGTSRANARLTEDDVKQIRDRHAMGDISQATLAREYGVTYQTIGAVLKRRKWAHVA